MKTFTITLKDNTSIKITCESYQHNPETNLYKFIISADKIDSIEESPKLADGLVIPRDG